MRRQRRNASSQLAWETVEPRIASQHRRFIAMRRDPPTKPTLTSSGAPRSSSSSTNSLSSAPT
eukprot:2898982-Pyramimonas_sp.AAC.1